VVNDDPIRARRARIAKWVEIGKRAGYLALLVAIVGFFAGLALDFPSWTVVALVGGLIVACVVLPLPIVLGYAVRAAEREDRGR
jgi:ABC-type molybdate transport system permease subunit